MSGSGLECDMTPEERVSVAEARARDAEQRLLAKRWQVSGMELALRTIRGRALERGDIPLAKFADESIKTLDCSPEQIREFEQSDK